MKIGNIVFLTLISLLSLMSCSGNNLFKPYRNEVPLAEAKSKYYSIYVDHESVDKIDDFIFNTKKHREIDSIIKDPNGKETKEVFFYEETEKYEYDSSSTVIASSIDMKTIKTVDSVEDVIKDYSYNVIQDGDEGMLSCNTLNKTYTVNVYDTVKEYAERIFCWPDNDIYRMMRRCYEVFPNKISTEYLVCYVDGKVFTCIFETVEKNDSYSSNKKVKVQNVFTSKGELFCYEEYETKTTEESDGTSVYSESYSYATAEYKFKNVSLTPVNENDYYLIEIVGGANNLFL